MEVKLIKAGKVIFGGDTLPIIAGPCVIESREHVFMMADSVAAITRKLDMPLVFKASFDKANRTAGSAYRGPGMEEGLRILEEIKTKFELPVLTDIHLPEQAGPVAEVADILQIPAFLSRQTDLLLAAAETGKTVNVKKGQFLSPSDMKYVVNKLEQTGNSNILLTERGAQFGYNNLVSDMRSLAIMRESGYPVIFDATHSAQLPGGMGSSTDGMREYIPVVTRAAVAAGCDGIFLEVHDNPENALSDATTQWPLDRLEKLLSELKAVYTVSQPFFKN